MNNKVICTYVSVWEDQGEIETRCIFNLTTKTVVEVESVDINDDDICEEEYIILSDGSKIKNFYVNGFRYVDGQRTEIKDVYDVDFDDFMSESEYKREVLIRDVINSLKNDIDGNDYSVLSELLGHLSDEILTESLPT